MARVAVDGGAMSGWLVNLRGAATLLDTWAINGPPTKDLESACALIADALGRTADEIEQAQAAEGGA